MLKLFRSIYPEVTFVVWKGETKKVTNVSWVAIKVVFILISVQYMEIWLFTILLLCRGVTQPLKDCPYSHYHSGDGGDSCHLHCNMG